MYPVEDLYRIAKEQNIPVISFPMEQCGSMSVMEGNQCCIGIDPRIRDGGIQERVHLGHELGHCITGSFYNIYTKRDLRRRHENRADKWAVRTILPVEALDNAIAQGYTTLWDLADYFQVTEDFIRKAVCLYTHGNLATELFF